MKDFFSKLKLIKTCLILQMSILLLSGCISGTGSWGSTGGSNNNSNVPTLPSVVSIALTPQESQINVGITQQYTATATYSDGSNSNVSSESNIIWSSSPESIATVSDTGLATGISTGSATISVSYTDSYGNKVESSTEIIIAATPVKAGWNISDPNIADFSIGISADSHNNIYTAGWSSSYTSYLNKYDVSGNLIWTHSQLGTITPTGIHADNQGNIYATGNNYDKGGYYLAKYDSESGQLQWSLQEYKGYQLAVANAVSTDNNGKIYLAGATNKGYLLAQYDESKLLWKVESGAKYARANAVSADNKGGVYITGYSGYKESNAFFIAKYDTNGHLMWMHQSGDANARGYGISTDNNYTVYVTGAYSNYSAFIAAYNTDGKLLWIINNLAKDGFGIGVSADNQGNVYALGIISESSFSYTGGYYLAKYDAKGTLWQWSTIKTSTAQQGGVSVDNNGRIYVTGNAESAFINQYLEY